VRDKVSCPSPLPPLRLSLARSLSLSLSGFPSLSLSTSLSLSRYTSFSIARFLSFSVSLSLTQTHSLCFSLCGSARVLSAALYAFSFGLVLAIAVASFFGHIRVCSRTRAISLSQACCRVLQCVAMYMCRSVLQCVAVCCSDLSLNETLLIWGKRLLTYDEVNSCHELKPYHEINSLTNS